VCFVRARARLGGARRIQVQRPCAPARVRASVHAMGPMPCHHPHPWTHARACGVRACMRACVRACMHACMCARASECICVPCRIGRRRKGQGKHFQEEVDRFNDGDDAGDDVRQKRKKSALSSSLKSGRDIKEVEGAEDDWEHSEDSEEEAERRKYEHESGIKVCTCALAQCMGSRTRAHTLARTDTCAYCARLIWFRLTWFSAVKQRVRVHVRSRVHLRSRVHVRSRACTHTRTHRWGR